MKILVIEDETGQLQDVHCVLQNAGYRVQAAEDETQALKIAPEPDDWPRVVAIIGSGKEIAALVRPKSEPQPLEDFGLFRDMVSKVAHEIRYPLQKIRINACLLEGTIKPGENPAKYIKKINDSVTELNSIVENILTYNRKIDLYRQPTDVNKALDEVLSDIEELMEGHSVRIVREYEQGLPLAVLDPFKIKQVFVNLITNAFHSMPSGGTLTIRTNDLPDRELLEIIFRDTGIGIPEGHLERVFDPFFTTRPGGIGLGLPVVQQLVGLHGGQLQVESQTGYGSEFRILLPACINSVSE